MQMKLTFCLQINTKVFYELILSHWVYIMGHAQITQNNKFAMSLEYLEENMRDYVDFLAEDKCQRFRQINTIILVLWLGMPKLPKITSLLVFCNISRKKWAMGLIFHMQISIKVSYKLILWFWWGWSSIRKVPKIASLQCIYNTSKKKVEMKFIFLHSDKHQSFLQFDFNTLSIKVSYKMNTIIIDGDNQALSKYSK